MNIGSWKTTRSIGGTCKASNRLSGPVLTANRLTALILGSNRIVASEEGRVASKGSPIATYLAGLLSETTLLQLKPYTGRWPVVALAISLATHHESLATFLATSR
jgi:hypothetical protein